MSKSDKFEKKARILLDESIEELSPEITRRLQQARYAAIEKAELQSTSSWSFFPQAATAVFAIVVVSVSVFFNFNEIESASRSLSKLSCVRSVIVSSIFFCSINICIQGAKGTKQMPRAIF